MCGLEMRKLNNLCKPPNTKVLSTLFLFLISPFLAVADPYNSAIDLFESSPNVKPFFEKSYAYAVFPRVSQGAFGLGGAYGEGKVYIDNSLVGGITLEEFSFGLQVGGQIFSEIIFLQDERAFDEFTGGTYEFSANASAVAIAASVQAQTGTVGDTAGVSRGASLSGHVETTYNRGTAVFTHSLGGLMFEIAMAGQRFKFQSLK